MQKCVGFFAAEVNGRELTLDADYEVKSSKNLNRAGTASVVLKGKPCEE